jgi:MATE family multidrug resistance protein
MASRALGEGRPREAGAVLRRGLAYSLWVSLAATAVLIVCGPVFLHAIGLERGLADGASRVLLVFSLSLPFYGASVATSSWMEGLARPGPGAWAMWAANLVNLAFDLVLVPGRFGLPALGAIGGACATLGARAFLALVMAVIILRLPDARELGVFDKPARDRAAEAEQRRIGFGAGVSNFFEVASFSGMNIIAGWIGGLAVAAWAIVLNVAALVFMVPLGLATAAAVRVGGAYGARDPRGVERAARVAFAVTAVFGVVVALAIWPTAGVIGPAYTSSRETLAMAVPALALACLMFAPDALQVVAAQSLRARGDVWVPSGTHLASYILLMTPLAWWLAIPRGLHIQGIVWAVIAASVVSCALLLGRFLLLTRRDRALGSGFAAG